MSEANKEDQLPPVQSVVNGLVSPTIINEVLIQIPSLSKEYAMHKSQLFVKALRWERCTIRNHMDTQGRIREQRIPVQGDEPTVIWQRLPMLSEVDSDAIDEKRVETMYGEVLGHEDLERWSH